MTEYDTGLDPEDNVSGWAIGGVTFAATIMFMVGCFQAIAGLAAIFNDEFFVVARNYTFDLDITAWGWIHLLLGAALAFAGWALFARKPWAGILALFLAVLSAINAFSFIPYETAWSFLVIALDCWVIWSLTRPGALQVD